MSPHAYTEDQLVEQPAIGLFAELGWQVANAEEEIFATPSLVPSGHPLPLGEGQGEGRAALLGRETPGEVVLESRLRAALAKLNPNLPAEAFDAAVVELTRDRSAMSPAAANRDICRLLKDGVKVELANVSLTRTLSQGERDSHYRGGFDRAGLVLRARELRQRQTPAEDVMWAMLRDRQFMGLKFRRQHQMGDYITDFYCDEAKLVVELDGSIHETPAKRQHDLKRDKYLRGLGLKVLHIQNETVLDDPDAAFGAVQAALPSTTGRGTEGEGEGIVRVKVIDWDNHSNNDFLLVSQMTVTGPLYTCRPDLIGFVNGLPLVVIELKKPGVPARQAFDENLTSYKHAQNGIPALFWYNALLIASNGTESRVGSLTADWERCFEWKRIEREDEPRRVSLETMLRGTCEPARLLDIVENFTVFSELKAGLVKIIAQNHQFLGVNASIRALLKIRSEAVEAIS